MKKEEIIGIISKKNDQFILTTEEGIEYTLYAIDPWESVPTDFGLLKFNEFIGEKVKATGIIKEGEIWGTLLHYTDCKDIIPPKIDDLKLSE